LKSQLKRQARTTNLVSAYSTVNLRIKPRLDTAGSPSRWLFNKDHPLVLCTCDRSFETRSSICQRLETPFELFSIRPCQWNHSAL